jgi:hypothetical protein
MYRILKYVHYIKIFTIWVASFTNILTFKDENYPELCLKIQFLPHSLTHAISVIKTNPLMPYTT